MSLLPLCFNELIQTLIIYVLISNEANIIALSHKQEIFGVLSKF